MHVVSEHAIKYGKLVKLAKKKLCYKVVDPEEQYDEKIEEEDDGNEMVARDPLHVKTKGAPRKRLKAYSEKRRNRCDNQGHNIRSCRISMQDDNPMGGVSEDQQIMHNTW